MPHRVAAKETAPKRRGLQPTRYSMRHGVAPMEGCGAGGKNARVSRGGTRHLQRCAPCRPRLPIFHRCSPPTRHRQHDIEGQRPPWNAVYSAHDFTAACGATVAYTPCSIAPPAAGARQRAVRRWRSPWCAQCRAPCLQRCRESRTRVALQRAPRCSLHARSRTMVRSSAAALRADRHAIAR